MAHVVAVVLVPLVRQCCGSWAPVSFSGPPSWKCADSSNLAGWSACRRCTVYATPGKGARRLPRGNASSRFCSHHSQGQAALQGAINVSLLCTLILRHWREPFLFNMRQVPMFPRSNCCVLREQPRRRLVHCLPLDHPLAVFLVSLSSTHRRGAYGRWPRPQRRLECPLQVVALPL